jgi:hypothetical protein
VVFKASESTRVRTKLNLIGLPMYTRASKENELPERDFFNQLEETLAYNAWVFSLNGAQTIFDTCSADPGKFTRVTHDYKVTYNGEVLYPGFYSSSEVYYPEE